jgi:hypothetical protein
MTWRALIWAAAAVALSMTLGGSSSAEEGPAVDYNRLGGYFELAGVYSWANYRDHDLSGSPQGGVSIRGGNRFHRNVAIEFQYEFMNNRTIAAQSALAMQELGVWQTDAYTHQVTFNARAYPWSDQEGGFFRELVDGRLQPYALTGIGAGIWATPDGDGVGFVARFGLGLDFYLTEHIALTLEGTYAVSAGCACNGARTTPKAALPVEGFLPLDGLDQVGVGLGAMYRF